MTVLLWCAVKTHKYSIGRVGPVIHSTFTGCRSLYTLVRPREARCCSNVARIQCICYMDPLYGSLAPRVASWHQHCLAFLIKRTGDLANRRLGLSVVWPRPWTWTINAAWSTKAWCDWWGEVLCCDGRQSDNHACRR